MTLQPSQPSFIRATLRPLAAGLASLALCACLHYAPPPPPAPEAVELSRNLSTLAPLVETGKNQEIAGQDYVELADSTVPPPIDRQVTIYGPPIAELHDPETNGLFRSDVVTKANATGDLLEKENVERYNNYAVQLHQGNGTVERRHGWLEE